MGSERVTRRLTAIVAADVAGYSRLIAADEEGTYVALRGHRTDLIDPKIKEFGGRIANTAGDSLLVEFPSVVDALRCSLDIQAGMRERNQEVPSTQRIDYRIGVNLGDVIEADGDLLGDGINVAARLETIADPGGIMLSSAAYEQVRGLVDAEFVDMGNRELKNIPTPVHVYAVSLGESGAIPPRPPARFRAVLPIILLIVLGGALVWWIGSWASSDTPPQTTTETTVSVADDQPSIAVLPFANKSDDSAQDYFSDGLTEDVITDLSKISSLSVMARGSSFQYRNAGLGSLKIGQELGVSYVLTGSVRKSGSRVRINARLVDVESGKNIWGARYDGGLEEIFALQDEVTTNIVNALQIKLSAKEKLAVGRRYTNSVEAYDAFLKGRREIGRFNRVGNRASRPFFEKAIQLDTTFANAFASLAWSYARGYSYSWDDDPEASLLKAANLARRAVDLDDKSNVPYIVLGLVQLYQLQHARAVSSLEKALDLNPNHADSRAMLAFILNYAGRPEKAAKLMSEAIQLNPFYPYVYLNVLGQSRFLIGDYDKAVELFTQATARNPTDTQGTMWLAASQALAGETEDAQWTIYELLAHNEGYTIQRVARRLPFKDQRQLDLVVQGLRKAGLPE